MERAGHELRRAAEQRGGNKPRVSGGKVDMDEVGDDVGEAEHWESPPYSDEEESDEESHEESEQFVRDAIARLQAGETSLQ